jgi:outer membrane protein assembly factor BamB
MVDFQGFTISIERRLKAMPTEVLTRSYDNGRTGSTYSETIFTPAAIAEKGLKRFKSLTVTGDDPRLEAQPLYVPNLTIDGTQRNVVFVATMQNNVWAFDADEPDESKHLIWKTAKPLGTPRHNPNPINTLWGILSTPVIDIETGRMYLCNFTLDANNNPALTVYRISIKDGLQVGPPLPLQAALKDANGQIAKDAAGRPVILHPDQNQRAGLLLVPLHGKNKTLYVATTGGENPGDPHGWLVAIDVDTFKITASWVSTPKSFGGGIWQGAAGPAADHEGHVYVLTGNGGYVNLNHGKVQDFTGETDFAETIAKLKYEKDAHGNATLRLTDWFIPFKDADRKNEKDYNYRDQDLGSAGPVLPPGTTFVFAVGKDGILYVLDRSHFGKVVGDLSVLKAPPIYVTYNGLGLPVSGPDLDYPLGDPRHYPSKTHHCHGSPACWDGPDGLRFFTWGENESLRAWSVDRTTGVVSFIGKSAEIASAALAMAPTGQGGMPGGFIAVTSNAKVPNTGLVWTLAPIDGDANRGVVEGIARVYDATELDPVAIDPGTPKLKKLWDSKAAGVTYNHSKFCCPIVVDGKFYVTTYDGRVDVYTLN